MIQIISLIAMICSLVGNIFVNNKHKCGFIIWTVANVLWIYVNLISIINVSQCIMFFFYGVLNVIGFIKWNKSDKKKTIIKLEEVEK